MSLTRPVWAEINLGHIAFNVGQFRKKLKDNCQLMAVVKANGYGHGDLEVARTALASGASWLAVAFPEEGMRLRRAGIAAPILVLGALSTDQLEICVTRDLVVSLHQWEIAVALANLARRCHKTVRVHIKVDTGMGRLGLSPDEVSSFIKQVRGLPGIEVQGIYTHFASAEESDKDYVHWQWIRFWRLLQQLNSEGICPPLRHAANTAATLYLPETHLDMVRVGLGIYGMYPCNRRPMVLKPSFSLKAQVAAVKRVPPGTAISYNSTYVTWKETTIGVLPVGYADGISRLLSNKAQVLVGGNRVPIVGRVCMDHTMIEVGDYPLTVGEEVTMIGKQDSTSVTVDDWAAWMGTINYEITCMIGKRVPRIYL